jgi:hypothetical protein
MDVLGCCWTFADARRGGSEAIVENLRTEL